MRSRARAALSKMAVLSTSFFLLSFLLLLAFAKCASQVPVFIWSKDSELNGATPVLAGHTVKGNDFEEKYLDRLFQSPQLIYVFIQDRLSVDDISHYGDAYSPEDSGAAFSNLKISMETANSSVVLPSVELDSAGASHKLVNLIKRKTDGLVREFSPQEHHAFDIKEFLLHRGKTNVCIFHLLPSSTSSPKEIFAQNDKLIGAIVEQASASGLPYSCILTSAAPNVDVETRYEAERRANMAHDRLRRDLSENAFDDQSNSVSIVNGSLFVDAGCILLYTEGVVFTYKEHKYDLFNKTRLNFTRDCSDRAFKDSITVSFKTENTGTFNLRMSFSLTSNGSSYEWSCSNTSLDVEGTLGGEHNKHKFRYDCDKSLTAPTKYSYSCFNVTLKNKNSSISFKRFQVQPFNANGTFSYAYDCIGFFTIPIFMGLITAGVLLVILFCGILSMLSLTTMDRFDDPKGQTIHVATS